jgi:hypothetical protein
VSVRTNKQPDFSNVLYDSCLFVIYGWSVYLIWLLSGLSSHAEACTTYCICYRSSNGVSNRRSATEVLESTVVCYKITKWYLIL